MVQERMREVPQLQYNTHFDFLTRCVGLSGE